MSGGRPFEADYIVVGAGAGGAVLAARLAEAGCTVIVIEAGCDPLAQEYGDQADGDAASDMPLADACSVPAFHAFSTEHEGMTADHWVRHYADRQMQQRDWRYSAEHDGVLYPRAQGLGGCTAHHAMIIVKPNACDWNHIADITGDESWRASRMQAYFERIERCRYRSFLWRWLQALTGLNPTGHGWRGWMTTEWVFPLRPVRDRLLWQSVLRSIGAAADAFGHRGASFETAAFDPNDHRGWNIGASGVRMAPLSTRRHRREGPRERLVDVARRCPDRLQIRLRTRVTQILFDGRRATGVRCIGRDGEEYILKSRRETLLAGGSFATPQLLMLSGIGDPVHLGGLGIPLVEPLPRVGCNLQDRYEIGVVSRMKAAWPNLQGVTYTVRDRSYRMWRRLRLGNYTSNGVMFSLLLKSRAGLAVPDLHCFSLLADFRGYYPGYSTRIRKGNYMSWVVLKAYTDNAAGTVRLQSADHRVPPRITFHSFAEGDGDHEHDLDALVAGVRFVRHVADAMDADVAEEEEPGRWRDSDAALKDYIAANAWGHHACGTCPIGPREQGGVIDSKFRVYGVEGLRVVDASVFPRIPGYFLASAVYMIAEKAADTLLDEVVPSEGS
ncbi:GMC family oxidoreductase [Rhizobium halophytocola]|uniref:Choline dehydrogenase n=1 Tax=Rhizobium halophytocola TaxID=735519 RepID=A0ABS4DUK0_9HYPH|nr:GMC family oxidoreductase [Rhizobium halophytocola]MBP1849378.1 choline dehydrogenase [Rhizobium halophytocola]